MRYLALALLAGLVLAPAALARRALGVARDVSGAGALLAPAPSLYHGPETTAGVGSSGGPVGYAGGPVLTSNRTHVIFWQPSGTPHLVFDPGYRPLVERFLRDVASASHSTSNVMALTGQYTDSLHRPAAYASRYAGAVLDSHPLPRNGCVEPPATAPPWTVCLTDQQLQAEIERVVAAHHLPTAERDVYFLLTPKGLGSCMDAFPADGCALGGPANGYCGYHQHTTDGQVDYAVIPYNAVPGHCQSNNPRPNGSTADPALSTMSHELAEMITDPNGDGWTDGSGMEIGDLCISTFGRAIGGSGSRRYNQAIAGGRFYLQDEWSNFNGACAARAKPDRASFAVSGRSGRRLRFTGSGSDPQGHIVAYHWRFGTGGAVDGRSVRHRFQQPGTYAVRLRVTDSWDNWGFYTRMVPVA